MGGGSRCGHLGWRGGVQVGQSGLLGGGGGAQAPLTSPCPGGGGDCGPPSLKKLRKIALNCSKIAGKLRYISFWSPHSMPAMSSSGAQEFLQIGQLAIAAHSMHNAPKPSAQGSNPTVLPRHHYNGP